LDAHCEDPETRDFAPGFLDQIERQRPRLLSAALTIWRYGRQHAAELRKGRPLGNFEEWCAWVRDPLLALGCSDPVERLQVVKRQDPHRQHIAELFQAWDGCHGSTPVKAAELADRVQKVIDPQGRGRQYISSRLVALTGTRAAGFVLTRQEAAGVWGAATYALDRTTPNGDDDRMGHRDHRDHQAPMSPMPPMPNRPDGGRREDAKISTPSGDGGELPLGPTVSPKGRLTL
jgi:hypothetical protein